MATEAEVDQAPVHVVEAVVQAAKHFKRQADISQEMAESLARQSRNLKDESDEYRAKFEQCMDWLDKNASGLELDF